MTHRVLLIEPYMGIVAGHPAAVARRVASALLELGAEVRVLGPADSPVSEWGLACELLPVWPRSPRTREAVWANRRLANRLRNAVLPAAYAARARRVLARQADTFRPDVVAVLSCDHTEFLALSSPPPDLRIIACAHSSPGTQRIARLSLKRFLDALQINRHLTLSAFTDEIRDAYVAAGAPADSVIRMPYPYNDSAASAASSPTGDFTLTYLGDARPEKGFVWLADSARDLSAIARLRLQCNPPASGVYDPEVRQAIENLEALESDRVELIRNALSTDEYADLIRSGHVTAIPYLPDCYPPGRLSGILADAWIAGRPVVTTDGWSAADEVKRTGAGVVCTYGDAAGLVAAVRELSDDFGRFEAAARTAGAGLVALDAASAAARVILDTVAAAPRSGA